MPQFQQPNFHGPRLSFLGKRQRVHAGPWATDQGVPHENDPNPDWGDLRIPQFKPHYERMRPGVWKRGEEDVGNLQTCTPGFFVTTGTDSDEGQTIYAQWNSEAVCYYNNIAVAPLAYTGPSPPGCGAATPTAITGSFLPMSVDIVTLRVWWNLFAVCGPPPPDTTFIEITNSGTCDLDVNGTLLKHGDIFFQNGLTQVFLNGDRHAFLGGSIFTVTIL